MVLNVEAVAPMYFVNKVVLQILRNSHFDLEIWMSELGVMNLILTSIQDYPLIG